MKSTKRVSLVLSVLVMLVGMSACGQDSAEKVSLPQQNAVAKSASENGSAENAAPVDAKNGASPAADADSAAKSVPAASAAPKQAAGVGERRFSGSFEPQRVTDIATNVGGIIRE